MSRILCSVCCLFFIAIFNPCFCETNSPGAGGLKNSGVSIEIILHGSVADVESVNLSFYNEYIHHNTGKKNFTQQPDRNHTIHFMITPSKRLSKIGEIVFKYKTLYAENAHNYDILRDFVVEPGDDIILDITIRQETIMAVHARGKQWLKYECRSKLALQYLQFYEDRKTIMPPDSLSQAKAIL